jgi:hypothetical protein
VGADRRRERGTEWSPRTWRGLYAAVGVQDTGKNFDAVDEPRTGTIEVRGAIDNVNVSGPDSGEVVPFVGKRSPAHL